MKGGGYVCKDCFKTHSYLAQSCPYCGHPNAFLKAIKDGAYANGKLDSLEGESFGTRWDEWQDDMASHSFEGTDYVDIFEEVYEEYYRRGWASGEAVRADLSEDPDEDDEDEE